MKDTDGNSLLLGQIRGPAASDQQKAPHQQSMQDLLKNRMIYKTIHKKSQLAKGGLCKIKLCQNVSEELLNGSASKQNDMSKGGKESMQNGGQMSKSLSQSNPSQQYAIKRFNKMTLRKNKQYLRKPNGQGMTVWT